MRALLIVIVTIVLAWIAYGYFSSRVKEPKFTVQQAKEPKFALRQQKNDYEIREYAPYIEARVRVSGTYREAETAGFRILAEYIFGGNTSKQSIAMTAPVSEQKSEAIAMTAPVSETVTDNNERVVSFVMPEEYTRATLPTPNDKRIEIVEVPAHTSAVLRYSGYSNAENVEHMKAKLLECMKRDGLAVVNPARSARYNPPWTPPFMMRNEVLVDIN
jgi:effector-binding domain-containing protein